MINSNFWKDKKVLITGFSGFKGFWLNLILSELGSDVHGISKKEISSEIFNLYNNIQQSDKNNFIDLKDSENLLLYLNKLNPDIIFHLAAQSLVITSKLKPKSTIETNVIGSFNILDWVQKSEKNITTVVATTDKVYKYPEKNNVEDDPLGSFEFYGASKVALENMIDAFNNDKNSVNKISVVRSGNVLGGGDGGENRILTDIIKSINNKNSLTLRNPESVRPWQFILDSIGGYVLVAQNHFENKTYDKFNLNSDELNEISVLELSNKIIQKFDSKISVNIQKNKNLSESKELRINSTKAKKVLSWNHFYNVDDIVENIYEWEKNKGSKEIKLETSRQINKYLDLFSQ